MTRFHRRDASTIAAATTTIIRPTAMKNRLMPAALYIIMGVIALLTLASAIGATAAPLPKEIRADEAKLIWQVHAVGLQIYECKADAAGKLTWQFREPLATLISEGKTVGRHFAGPGWEFNDGSRIKGKVVAQAPGASEKDIPVLRLDVIQHDGSGDLSKVDTVQRLDTKGGIYSGACDKTGDLHSEPYSADYVFLTR
ncbi:DUF3455 domain-containing protein [Rhizobium sp. AC27/96]|uniref:DUF3455 domain-containing protein n=1 Tax=Rhizobium sp. AC27/96 TaxID=1841653 RepID=UPI000AC94783|nr:DUF3455 domain-containing protein [Rhizobium sp. AC27/96]